MKKFKSKLTLKKEVISSLNEKEMSKIKGGELDTSRLYPCYPSNTKPCPTSNACPTTVCPSSGCAPTETCLTDACTEISREC